MGLDNPFLKRAYTLNGNKQKTRAFYGDWAEKYDQDTVEGMGYVAPGLAAKVLTDQLTGPAKVLDAGCGTGLVGEKLKDTEGLQLEGIDLSPDMLNQAAKKHVYRTLSEADMTRPLDIEDNSYDAVISVGVFTSGHVGPEALEELTRVAKPGAPVVVTVHEKVWEADEYLRQIVRMKGKGMISTFDLDTVPYHEREGYSCQLCVLEAA